MMEEPGSKPPQISKPTLFRQVRSIMRAKYYHFRTEESYLIWIQGNRQTYHFSALRFNYNILKADYIQFKKTITAIFAGYDVEEMNASFSI